VRCLHAALALLSFSTLPLPAFAAPAPYGVRLPRDGIVVEVPYTLGTHHEHVTAVDGAVRVDARALRLDGGRLVFPLAGFRSDDPKRGCHLREALGLDYARSRFPGEHVCDEGNRLPATGPDAVAFPSVVLELRKGEPVSGGAASGAGADVQVDAEGVLTVRGTSRPVKLKLAVSRSPSDPDMLRVRGRVPLRLADFGVQVKPARVLFVSIAVGDEVTVDLDVLLEPLRAPGPG
jgi:polyisoprenoid-binding protein YceI